MSWCQPTATWRPRGASSPRALRTGTIPAAVTTGRAAVDPPVIDELIPAARPTAGRYANNPGQAGHGRLKARLGRCAA
jgi:IS6 family transposase